MYKKTAGKKMKILFYRNVILFLCSIFLCGIFTSCSDEKKNESTSENKLQIVVSTYPLYDWVKNIVQDKADVNLLINSGTDFHSWQPGVKDIISVTGKDTDLFIYVGGESDFWVEDLISEMDKNGVKHFSVMKENQELLEPMEEHDHEHGHSHDDSENNHNEDFDPDEYDEHIWLSLQRAPDFIISIAHKIAESDMENEFFYISNCNNYIERIQQLYLDAREVVEDSPHKLMVITDRNPFKYLFTDLQVQSYAAFHGCSADTEASFDVIIKLVDIIKENNLTKIVISETGNEKLADTVKKNKSIKIEDVVVLNSLQGGQTESYLDVMAGNIEKLRKILE